jgi:hypothetical protein
LEGGPGAGEQIEVALLDGTSQPSGSVNGVQPAYPEPDLVIGLRPSPPEPLPVERLREAATAEALQLGLVDPGGVSGRNGLHLVLVLATKGIPPEAIVEALILGFEWPHELDQPLGFTCALDAVSESAIVVAGVVYPALGCGEAYPLSGTDELSTDAPSDAVLAEADSPSAVESTGGRTTETNGASFVGHLRDDNLFELENLLPGKTIELAWTPNSLYLAGTLVTA